MIIKSKNGIPVRLTSERWTHITSSHTDMNDNKDLLLKTVENPDMILKGVDGELRAVRFYQKIIPHVVRSPQRRIWIDYDEDADVLYMNFTYPPKAVEHEEDENGIVKNYDEKGNLTGLTIIGATRFLKG
ncbi:MAG: DUF2283 domain-containing protein [Methanophagales archaeon]|nr:DUF2283 domain-containing protein [Methanophagales archaeon]